jgi:glycosyl transferase family 25
MPVFYINVAARTDRRATVEKRLAELGIAAERIDAVTPPAIDPTLIARFCNPASRQWVTPPELACTLSHQKFWQTIVDHNLPMALVLEDDVLFSARLPEILQATPAALAGLDIVRTETNWQDVCLGPAEGELVAGIAYHRYYTRRWGTWGYIATASGARKMLQAQDLYAMPIDELMFNPTSPMFKRLASRQLIPAFCTPADESPAAVKRSAESDLETARLQRQGNAEASLRRVPLRRFFSRLRDNISNSVRKDAAGLLHGARYRSVPFADAP